MERKKRKERKSLKINTTIITTTTASFMYGALRPLKSKYVQKLDDKLDL